MELLAVELLSRWQFGFTAAIHILFPSISIGLSFWLVYWYYRYLKTENEAYLKLYNFWKKIFAVGFGLGIVSGTVMTFEFGLNWSRYAHAVGPILGVIISMEVITAFFLEAGFIGIMLYAGKRVSKKVMFLATCMVALGTLMSMTWIMSANSWMQTPEGYEFVNGQFLPKDWMAIIFNKSFVIRLLHIVLGVALTSTLVVNGVSAYYLLKKRDVYIHRRVFNQAMVFLTILIPFQLYVGDETALLIGLEGGQTGKLLALEGHFNDESADWLIAIDANQKEQKNNWQFGIPKLGGLLINKDPNKPIPGLNNVPVENQPPVNTIFYTFRIMFFIAILIYIFVFAGLFARVRGTFFTSKFLQKFAVYMSPIGFVAIVCGWLTAEIGRQPFVVYGLLRTDEAYSMLTEKQVAITLSMIILIYAFAIMMYLRYFQKQVRVGLK